MEVLPAYQVAGAGRESTAEGAGFHEGYPSKTIKLRVNRNTSLLRGNNILIEIAIFRVYGKKDSVTGKIE